ncbi:unnamed protein product [Miscanthus lutarioriparius]|uniref:14-3-3 domain-containing protein n=1 Tax=Miscanthus lutarioriparius TaxID=422564 RepID=A0A811PGJ0_9POAL|nr:unnamed protein product [Miscanthus lutarioriparius]
MVAKAAQVESDLQLQSPRFHTKDEEEGHGNEDRVTLIKDYRSKIEVASSKVCDGILKLIDSHIVPSSTAPKSKVESRCIRYLMEFKTGSEKKDAAENTMVAYKAAQSWPPPILLGLGWCSTSQLS